MLKTSVTREQFELLQGSMGDPWKENLLQLNDGESINYSPILHLIFSDLYMKWNFSFSDTKTKFDKTGGFLIAKEVIDANFAGIHNRQHLKHFVTFYERHFRFITCSR